MSTFKKDLLDKSYFLPTERNKNNPYLNLHGLDDVVGSGLHSFYIQGSDFLARGSEILFEIVDSSGAIIDIAGVRDLLSGNSSVVSFEVDTTAVDGNATMYVSAVLSNYVDSNGVRTTIPADWSDVPNILFEYNFIVNKSRANTDDVIFRKTPHAVITPSVKNVVRVQKDTLYVGKNSISGSALLEYSGSLNTSEYADLDIIGTVNASVDDGSGFLLGGDLVSYGVGNQKTSIRNNLIKVGYDGVVSSTRFPWVRGIVQSVAHESNSGDYFIGGDFTQIDHTPFTGIVRVDSTGDMHTSFTNPLLNGVVHAIVPVGEFNVLVGGSFTQVGGSIVDEVFVAAPHSGSVLLDINGHVSESCENSSINGIVYDIAHTPPDSFYYVVGNFNSVGGETYNSVAKLSMLGVVDTSFTNPEVNGTVYSITIQSDGKLLLAGDFTSVGGVAYSGSARLNSNGTLDTSFSNPGINGVVYAIKPQTYLGTNSIVVGGSFTEINQEPVASIARLLPNGNISTVFTGSQFNGDVKALNIINSSGDVAIHGNFSIYDVDEERFGVIVDRKKSSLKKWVVTFNATSDSFNADMIGSKIYFVSRDDEFSYITYNKYPTTRGYSGIIRNVINPTEVEIEFQNPDIDTFTTDLRFPYDDTFIPLNSEINFFVEYVTETIPLNNVLQQSAVVDILVKDIETVSGDVEYIRVSTKSDALGEDSYEVKSASKLDLQPSLLKVSDNLDIGRFTRADKLTYWTASIATNAGSSATPAAPTIGLDTEFLVGGMFISGSASGDIVYAAIPSNPLLQEPIYSVKSNTSFDLNKDIRYKIRLDAQVRNVVHADSRLDVYVSGSGLPEGCSNRFGTLVHSFRADTDTTWIDRFDVVYESDVNITNASLIFVLTGADWSVRDIRIAPETNFGFSPFEFRKTIPLTVLKERQDFDFKIEFFDGAGKKVDEEIYVDNIIIDRPNIVIQGQQNYVSGSLVLGGTPLDAHIQGSTISSDGYKGFNEALLDIGRPGFLIWSGSIQTEYTNYDGVGLELVADENNFFKYGTSPSSVEIVTEKFFVGNIDTQFISGSDGNIEISSSLFHLNSADGTFILRNATRQTADGDILFDYVPRGFWAEDEIYYVGNLVQFLYEDIVKSYVCLNEHTSSAVDPNGPPIPDDPDVNNTDDTTRGNWQLFSGGYTSFTKVDLTANSFTIAYDRVGNLVGPATVTLSATVQNFENPYFKFTSDNQSLFADESTFTDGISRTLDTASFSSPTTSFTTPINIRVGVSESGSDSQVEKSFDVITITPLKQGADSEPFYAISLPSGSIIKNSNPDTTLILQASRHSVESDPIEGGFVELTSGDYKLVESVTNWSGSQWLSNKTGQPEDSSNDYTLALSASLIDGQMTFNLQSGSKVYDTATILDVTDGLGGGVFQTPHGNVIHWITGVDGSGNYDKTFLPITASFFTPASSVEYSASLKIYPSRTGSTDFMYYETGVTSDAVTLSLNNGDGTAFGDPGSDNQLPTKDIVITATYQDAVIRNAPTQSITETLYIVSDGLDGLDALNVTNTNPLVTLRHTSGTTDIPSSEYAGTGTTLQVFEGLTALVPVASDATPSAGQWKISSVSIAPDNISVGTQTVTAGSTNNIVIGNHSAFTEDSTVTITYNIDGIRRGGVSFTAETIQTIVILSSGNTGLDGSGPIYRGDWVSGTTYFYDNIRRDVVRDDLDYYTLLVKHPNGFSSTTRPSQDSDTWASFVNFQLLATDLLFAQTAYVNKILNVGSRDGIQIIQLNPDEGNDGANPYIGINASAFNTNGIYMGYSSINDNSVPVFSIQSGSNGLSFNGSTLTIKGAIRQTSGGSTIVDYVNKGTWASGTNYAVNDLVQHVGDDETTSTYACVTAHTSTTATSPPDNSYWTVFAEGSVGIPGSSAKALFLTSTAQAFKVAKDGTVTPPLIEFTASLQNIDGNVTWSRSPEVTFDTADNTGTLSSSNFGSNTSVQVTATKITIYRLADGLDGEDGEDAYTVILTNEVHTFPADSNGVVASDALAAGVFEVRVFKGDIPYVNSGNQSIPRRYTATVNSATGITGNFATVGDEAIYTPTGVNSDSGDVVVTINVFDTASSVASITLTKTYTFSKSKAGTAGSSAKALFLTSTAQAFKFDKNGVVTPSLIEFTPSLQNIDGDVTWSSPPGVVLEGTGSTKTLPSSEFGDRISATITASKDGFSDSITIYRLVDGDDGLDGEDAYTVFLTNEVHTFPADSSGVVASTALAAGLFEVRVFKGTTRYVNSGNQGIPRRYAATVSATGITGNFATTSGGEARYTPTGVNSDSGAVVVTINVFDTTGTTISATLIKTYTFAKSKAGTDGTLGAPGPGVVFRGEWASGQTYTASATRRDVVIFNTTYYYATTTHTSTSGNSPTSSNNPWSQFGAQFESVATDILLAQDATITRGLVMGSTDAPNSGLIRSVNATAFDAGIGYYFQGGGAVRFGDPSGEHLAFSGGTLSISGSITADSGKIGGFNITQNTLDSTSDNGSVLIASNQIQVRDTSGAPRFIANNSTTLPSPAVSGYSAAVSSSLTAATVTSGSPISSTTVLSTLTSNIVIGTAGVGSYTFSCTVPSNALRAIARGSVAQSHISIQLVLYRNGTEIAASNIRSASAHGSDTVVELDPLRYSGVESTVSIPSGALSLTSDITTTGTLTLRFRITYITLFENTNRIYNSNPPSAGVSITGTSITINGISSSNSTVINGGGFLSKVGTAQWVQISPDSANFKTLRVKGGIQVGDTYDLDSANHGFLSFQPVGVGSIFNIWNDGESSPSRLFIGTGNNAAVSTLRYSFDSNGSVVFDGSLTQNGTPSDITYKQDILPITGSLDLISSLIGHSFNWKLDSPKNSLRSETDKRLISDYGVVAQEVELVAPRLVTDNGSHKSVNYDGIIAILIESIKELKDQVIELQTIASGSGD